MARNSTRKIEEWNSSNHHTLNSAAWRDCKLRYRSNFLKQVILRLDFNALPALQSDKQTPFSEDIKDQFPNVRPSAVTQIAFFASAGGTSFDQQTKGWQWIHTGAEGEGRTVTLSPEFLALEYGAAKYRDYAEFRAILETIYSRFQRRFGVEQFNRVGLRYINEVLINEGNALEWNGLIAPELVTAIQPAFAQTLRMTRSMHQVAAIIEDVSCLAQYGIANPDYPNPIARRQFILDFDASVSGGVPNGELLRKVDTLNQLCERMFEASIEDGLRQRMGVIQ